jgi:hypothetical protein
MWQLLIAELIRAWLVIGLDGVEALRLAWSRSE